MQLYIAEKPDMAKAIAGYLWPDGSYNKNKGYYEKNGVEVTWAFGHILSPANPEAYDEKYKHWQNYPVLPERWKYTVPTSKKEQLDIIRNLLKGADEVIHAGDPDREGQLLIDEILYFAGYKGKVKRLLLNAKDDTSLKRAFSNIQDNGQFKTLYEAGLARQKADWLVGMNLTRCYTVQLAKFKYDTTLRIGRVKTPTLALVVNRELEIKNFVKHSYYDLKAFWIKDGVTFGAKLVAPERIKQDENGHALDKAVVYAIAAKIKPASCTVTKVKREKGRENPPLPYSLDTLQIDANRVYKMSPKKVLDTVQELYEAKYVSYPRSDCNYIPAAQHADAAKILPMLKNFGIMEAGKANTAIQGQCWNDKKVTAHHAIIPTEVKPENLKDDADKIYKLIARRYIMQFFEPCDFEVLSYEIQASDEVFKGSGRLITKYGFRGIVGFTKEEQADDAVTSLPELKEGEVIGKPCEVAVKEGETKPPKRFTEGTLVKAMTNIYKFMEPGDLREKLKETKGIGTPATRDTIIDDLLATEMKGRKLEPFLKKVKNELVPTDFGMMAIANIDKSLTKPDITAELEYKLSDIQSGKYKITDFIKDTEKMILENIQYAENHKFPLGVHETFMCPVCGKGELLRRYSPKSKKAFYICSNEECINGYTGKKYFFEEEKGKPVIKKCPEDGTVLRKLIGKNGAFWICDKCKKTFNDKTKGDGK